METALYYVNYQVPDSMARRLIADILPIGERGREMRKFIERDLGGQGMHRSVLVIAPSNKPVLIRADDSDVMKERNSKSRVCQWHG